MQKEFNLFYGSRNKTNGWKSAKEKTKIKLLKNGIYVYYAAISM